MNGLRGSLWSAVTMGILVLFGCNERQSEAQVQESKAPSPDSTVILDAMRSVQVGDELVELNWTTLGDVSAELGGTPFEWEDQGLVYWQCFDLESGLRVMLGAPEIPGEPQDLERFAAGPSSWVGGPEQCDQTLMGATEVQLANGLAMGDSTELVLEMLGEPQARRGSSYYYRARKEETSGLPLLGELEVLVESGRAVGLRGLRCYCGER